MIAQSTKRCFLLSRSWPFCKYLNVSNSRGSEENLTGKKRNWNGQKHSYSVIWRFLANTLRRNDAFFVEQYQGSIYMISLSARTVSLTRIIHATSCFFLSRFIFFQGSPWQESPSTLISFNWLIQMADCAYKSSKHAQLTKSGFQQLWDFHTRVLSSDQLRFLRNCLPAPTLSQHFALSEN